MTPADACPCKSGHEFSRCCGPYLGGGKQAPTAEALMRSRYAAFATGHIDYLETTLLPGTREDFDRAAATEWALSSQWLGLEIRSVERGGAGDEEGYVEFVAHFSQNGQEQIHHETGHFVKRDGRWWYVDGVRGTRPRQVLKIGRNDPCICGSNRKYKKCCGREAA